MRLLFGAALRNKKRNSTFQNLENGKSNHVMLQPLDILLALKIAVNNEQYTQSALANELDVSVSQINRAINRCAKSGLLDRKKLSVARLALYELLSHGVRYVYPVKPGSIERGIPTAHSASPLKESVRGWEESSLVWPDPTGKVRGESLKPLYKTVPFAAQKDEKLYEALALVDAIRVGRARERNLARDMLQSRIEQTND